MASILDKYGIKEVADVTFYEINADGTPGAPVLYLDTLKVSTVETTAETTYATGGKGNANLIAWDYGKAITVALNDALFSQKSLSIMMGNGKVQAAGSNKIKKTIEFVKTATNGVPTEWIDANGNKRTIASPVVYDESNEVIEDTSSGLIQGNRYFVTFEQEVTNATEILVNASSYPGTYYVTGDTFVRSQDSGKDEYFQFIIPKAKMASEASLTMESEGDPSTFDMNLTVLRPKDGNMMKLVKYDLPDQ